MSTARGGVSGDAFTRAAPARNAAGLPGGCTRYGYRATRPARSRPASVGAAAGSRRPGATIGNDRAGMADGNAAAWAVLSGVRAYRAVWEAHAAAVAFEDAPFPIRIQSEADLRAREPWRLQAWENPFARNGPLAPFWDVPMLMGEGSAEATPFLPLLAAAGARLTGLRLRDGALILRIEHEGRAILIRLARDGPLLAGGGLRLWHDFGLELPMAIARLTDLLGLVGCPAPRLGRVRWARNGN